VLDFVIFQGRQSNGRFGPKPTFEQRAANDRFEPILLKNSAAQKLGLIFGTSFSLQIIW